MMDDQLNDEEFSEAAAELLVTAAMDFSDATSVESQEASDPSTPPRSRFDRSNAPSPVIFTMRNTRAPANVLEMQEEAFHSRPEIRIPTTDKMKSILVDDWENVTKNLWLVPLPSKTPVSLILSTYFEEEKGKRRLGSPEADLLEEITSGLIEYFGVSLGRVLLYTFERDQYAEIRSRWEETAGDETWEQQGCADTYGAEHLVRLFGKFIFSATFKLSSASLWFLCILAPVTICEIQTSNMRSRIRHLLSKAPPCFCRYASLTSMSTSSDGAGADRTNQHGRTVDPAASRGDHQADDVDHEAFRNVLQRAIRARDPGVH
jgi:hypothetical protein